MVDFPINAVELLGTDLIRVTGLLGILMSFETLIGRTFVVILIAKFLNAARLADAITMLGLAAVVTVFRIFFTAI